MGPDLGERFAKKNPELVPQGEQIRAAIVAEAKGGAWRRGMRSAGVVGNLAAEVAERRAGDGAAEGGAAAWPPGSFFWLVLTDRQLHVYEGRSGSPKAGPAAAHFPLETIANMDFQKKLMISKLHVSFSDGSGVELDVAKQNTKPFLAAIGA